MWRILKPAAGRSRRIALTAVSTCFVLGLLGQSCVIAQDAARKKSANNLKQLALAMVNYADANNGKMPPATVYSKDGKPLYSWRVLLLPYLEEEKLFKQFKLDEPWDSDNNKKLLGKMPKVFAPVQGETKEKHATFYQVFLGEGAAFEDKQVIKYPASFQDGTSNTVLIVEAADAVPWTKPADLKYDPKKDPPKLGGLFKDGFHAAFADGSVRFIKKNVDKKLLHAIITRAGNEEVDLDKLP
jgi:hypothetical protein